MIQKPVVTGITSVGLDHIAQLGPTIQNVAWHKSGISKAGTVDIDPSLPSNCSLALALAHTFLERKALSEKHHITPDDVIPGIEKFSWQGRFEAIVDGYNKWFLDGAHNRVKCQTSR